ncbi:MFS general substrate transporter [Fomitopsis serialis]|uniref:MFS general substrate transporter n=1 Tax=Fomitopsis serialis TaxID=139415 RepID=UPI002007CAE9|nr:MFS general substrate transporter [Neoantrodia serialis]KAH9921404.1 MFS general substrate transporter [Neoantrodia serialis]
MSHPDGSTQQTRRRQAYQDDPAGLANGKNSRPDALATSLESISVRPRTPKTARGRPWDEDGLMDDVELSLLDKEEPREAEADVKDVKRPMSTRDRRAIILLIILYLIQGFPLGLALGSLPFLLREHLSYSQLATFSLASYPYSLKLFWSPIVDAVYTPALGRRKSWIIPMQILVGSIMTILSFYADEMMQNPAEYINVLTAAFTTLVFLSATQDIAVDGWALTLLSEENLSFASTCQTIGLNTGYLLSYTVFLALNSQAFAEKWGIPRLELGRYLLFCSMISFGTTIWLFFEKEDEDADVDMSIKSVYKTMWTICRLKHVRTLLAVHLFAKIAFQAHDAVTSLKMVEKGLGREDMAVAVLIDFPFSILGGLLAGRWSRGDKPLDAWINSYWPRLILTLASTLTVYWFPTPPISTAFFALIIIETVAASFASTIQFGGMAAFHTRVSDPIVGGTYMTLFATFSNLGGTWPRYFVLKGVDFFSVATCQIGDDIAVQAAECVSEHGKAVCAQLGGKCVTEQDGYYTVSGICLGLGLLSVVFFMIPTARKLQAIPPSRWRVISS